MAKKKVKKTTQRKSPTNNGLAQGKSSSAWPMWAPNNMKKTKGASPFTGSSGASY